MIGAYGEERPNADNTFDRRPSTFFYGNVALGNMTMYKIATTMLRNGYLFIAIENKGCYEFEHFAHANYVQDKLRLMEGDAGNIADFINDQFPNREMTERQGRYNKL